MLKNSRSLWHLAVCYYCVVNSLALFPVERDQSSVTPMFTSFSFSLALLSHLRWYHSSKFFNQHSVYTSHLFPFMLHILPIPSFVWKNVILDKRSNVCLTLLLCLRANFEFSGCMAPWILNLVIIIHKVWATRSGRLIPGKNFLLPYGWNSGQFPSPVCTLPTRSISLRFEESDPGLLVFNLATAWSRLSCRSYEKKKTPWLESASELYRPSDLRLSAKLMPAFCG
jgi:hypothetical protein